MAGFKIGGDPNLSGRHDIGILIRQSRRRQLRQKSDRHTGGQRISEILHHFLLQILLGNCAARRLKFV